MTADEREVIRQAVENYHNALRPAESEYEAMLENLDPVRLHDARVKFQQVNEEATAIYFQEIGVAK